MTRIPAWVTVGAVLSLALILSVAVALWLRYDDLPERFPRHYGITGHADAFGAKTPGRVFAPPLLGLITSGLMFFNAWAIARSSRIARPQIAIRMMGILGLWIAMLTASAASGPLFGGAIPGGPWTLLMLTGAILATAIIGSVKLAAAGTPEDTPEECWHIGGIYHNRDDASLMVAKRRGLGMTVNFAHPLAWIYPAALVLTIVAIGLISLG
jgi:uncharacterized membrane protein